MEQGAQWKDHWAFIPPKRPAVPVVKDAAWARNPVDNFILAKLEANGLTTGSGSGPQHADSARDSGSYRLAAYAFGSEAFLNDDSDGAYNKMVDRLLASPHYGEHMAHYWLDAARYADTQGLHIDNYREMWPYRDWVINAYNRNLPFDEFTVEQLAGDLLPNATLDQKVASGFQRCNVTTNEGGSIPAEVEAMYARDRADTTGTVWMGLTVGCATCHDHKFDPIAQKEMYSLTAFFRNTTQYALDGNVPNTPPVVTVPSAQDRAEWDRLEKLRAQLEATLDGVPSGSNPEFERWLRSPARHHIRPPFKSSELMDVRVNEDARVSQRGRFKPVPLPASVTLKDGPPHAGKALHFGKEAAVKLPNVAEIDTDKPFTIAMWLRIPKVNESFSLASQIGSEPGGEAKGKESKKEWGWSARVTSNNTEPSMVSLMLEGRDGKYISVQPAPH